MRVSFNTLADLAREFGHDTYQMKGDQHVVTSVVFEGRRLVSPTVNWLRGEPSTAAKAAVFWR